MKREQAIWMIVLLIGVALVVARVTLLPNGMGKGYIKVVPAAVDEAHPEGRWMKIEGSTLIEYQTAQSANPAQTQHRLSLSRTAGIWIAAFFTLAIFSFLYRDNPFYKLAECILVGVSAAYWMVVGFWDVIVPNLIGRLAPAITKAWALPGLEGRDTDADYWYIIPLILGAMLLWRLLPNGAWIARWPLAFVIGTTAGIRLVGFIHADFLTQIRATIVPLAVMENNAFQLWPSVSNVIIVFGVLACLVYFFFSFEHTGFVGKTARVGTWVLMITFGAAFGYTVMGRIALLAGRLEFLFDDWLWLIDPTGRRAVSAAAGLLWTPLSTVPPTLVTCL
jgi:hypothetical protein